MEDWIFTDERWWVILDISFGMFAGFQESSMSYNGVNRTEMVQARMPQETWILFPFPHNLISVSWNIILLWCLTYQSFKIGRAIPLGDIGSNVQVFVYTNCISVFGSRLSHLRVRTQSWLVELISLLRSKDTTYLLQSRPSWCEGWAEHWTAWKAKIYHHFLNPVKGRSPWQTNFANLSNHLRPIGSSIFLLKGYAIPTILWDLTEPLTGNLLDARKFAHIYHLKLMLWTHGVECSRNTVYNVSDIFLCSIEETIRHVRSLQNDRRWIIVHGVKI